MTYPHPSHTHAPQIKTRIVQDQVPSMTDEGPRTTEGTHRRSRPRTVAVARAGRSDASLPTLPQPARRLGSPPPSSAHLLVSMAIKHACSGRPSMPASARGQVHADRWVTAGASHVRRRGPATALLALTDRLRATGPGPDAWCRPRRKYPLSGLSEAVRPSGPESRPDQNLVQIVLYRRRRQRRLALKITGETSQQIFELGRQVAVGHGARIVHVTVLP